MNAVRFFFLFFVFVFLFAVTQAISIPIHRTFSKARLKNKRLEESTPFFMILLHCKSFRLIWVYDARFFPSIKTNCIWLRFLSTEAKLTSIVLFSIDKNLAL